MIHVAIKQSAAVHVPHKPQLAAVHVPHKPQLAAVHVLAWIGKPSAIHVML
jgi:hypothetical protein